MKVLVLGGTGAMGHHLIAILSSNDIEVYVTSRTVHKSSENVHFIQGNALDNSFLFEVLQEKYDAIIDFMNYSTRQFQSRINNLCEATSQYFYLSSARVYADSIRPITEDSPRLLDVSDDSNFLKTDDYALAKARQEDLLLNSNYSNWTIIRPYVTYSNNRLQLCDHEHNSWLYRICTGRTVVMSKDVYERITTFTYGYDVSYCISKLIGNSKALGQIFHITSSEHFTWKDICGIYFDELKRLGYKCNLKIIPQSYYVNSYRLKYDRLYDRKFDNTKLYSAIGEYPFSPVKDSLKKCLAEFLQTPKFANVDQRLDAITDKLTGERVVFSDFKNSSKLDFVIYITYRYLPIKIADIFIDNFIFKAFRYGISLFK